MRPEVARQADIPEKAPGLGNWLGTPVFKKHWAELLSQVKESQSAFLLHSSPHSSQLEISEMGLPISEPYRRVFLVMVMVILQGLPGMINSIGVCQLTRSDFDSLKFYRDIQFHRHIGVHKSTFAGTFVCRNEFTRKFEISRYLKLRCSFSLRYAGGQGPIV